MPIRVSEELQQEIVAAYQSGLTRAKVAALYKEQGVSEWQVRAILERDGVSRPRKVFSVELEDKIIADYTAGASQKEICDRYDIHLTSIYNVLERRGIAVRFPEGSTPPPTPRARIDRGDGFYLGILCPRGHDPENAGKSLRRAKDGHCTVCEFLRSQTPEAKQIKRASTQRRRSLETKEQTAERIAKLKLTATCEHNPETVRNYRRNKYQTDENHYIRMRLRSNLKKAFNRYTITGKVKTSREYGINWTVICEALGPCPGEFKKWHIDHKVPMTAFDLTDRVQVLAVMHHTNLQWLPAAVNIAKHNHYDPADKEALMQLVLAEIAMNGELIQ